MKQLNWYQIFGNTHTIPEGSTVTPTDDVQILLHCANIWDKSYTTIGEVIADDDTLFLTLIDNNAIDYLVRSTTFASSIVADESAMQYIGASDYTSDTLLSDSTWLTAISGSAYRDYVLNASVPTMTSNTTPEGVVTASSFYNDPTHYPWQSFDSDTTSTGWEAAVNQTTNQWLQYEFTRPITLKEFKLKNFAGRLKDYRIEASNDNFDNETVILYTGQYPNSATLISECINNTTAYKYYRIYCLNTYGGNYLGYMYLLRFNGREVGGVQSWLKAGGITNKKYTTVSEVLSDLTTLATLMSSTDAIDYLVTAKGWATEICSDSNAMADIGMNNYAANTLLADETWCKAIGSSAYFASVLNVSVPVMTSDTQPYGTVTYSSQVSPYYGFYAFDQANSQGWCDTGYRYSVDSWIAYEFPSAVKIYKAHILIRYDSSSNTMKGKIQAGNDNVDMGSFTEVTSSDNDGVDVFINNPLLEKKWRLISTQAMANTNSNGMKIQFYGRKDI